MKKQLLFLSLFLFFGNLFAQTTVMAQASAEIVIPQNIEIIDDLYFGKISTSGIDQKIYSANNGHSAIFKFSGMPNTKYTVTLPSPETVVISKTSNKSEGMVIERFYLTETKGITNNFGFDYITINAILIVKSGQSPGMYNGVFYINIDQD